MFDNEYITLQSVAALLNLPAAYLKRLADAKQIPFIDTGNGRRRFMEADVRNALSLISKGQKHPSPLQQKLGEHYG